MVHEIDVGVYWISAPNYDEVRLFCLAWVDTALPTDPRSPTRHRWCHADRANHAGIAQQTAQSFNAVALHDTERSARMIGPNGFRPMLFRRRYKGIGNSIECLVPTNPFKISLSLRTDAAHRMGQPVGVMDPLRIAPNLFAHDTGGERQV